MEDGGCKDRAALMSQSGTHSLPPCPQDCIALHDPHTRTHSIKLCIAFCRGNSEHWIGLSWQQGVHPPPLHTHTPTWRAGDEENGEGQFGSVSHFPSESDPLAGKRFWKYQNKNYFKNKNLKATESNETPRCTEEQCLCKNHLCNLEIEAESQISRVIRAVLVQTQNGRGRGGGGWRWRGTDGCWYFQVHRRAMEDDLLAFKPGLSCFSQVCSIVVVHFFSLVFNLLYSDPRSTEPSHSRAGLTFIGLEIERTPLSNQTSLRITRSNVFKTPKAPFKWPFPLASYGSSGF